MKKICVITGTRADYGLLYWTLKRLQNDPALELQIIATGAHLSEEFGSTFKNIEADGFQISLRVDMEIKDDSFLGISDSMAKGITGFARAFTQLRPDLVLVLGDRYEALVAAETAMMAGLPMAHIHGGECTEGAVDDAIRHSLSKMAHLHFTATETYRKRVIQLGESPERVFNVGAPGLENIVEGDLLSREEIEKDLGLRFQKPSFLVTYHPETLEKRSPKELFTEVLKAFDSFPEAQLIFTFPNADANNQQIVQLINSYVEKNSRAVAFKSLGQRRYLSLLQFVDVVIGNSSSGIIEVPSFKKPTVNIGHRQTGRIMAKSVIHCETQHKKIQAAIKKALSPQFTKILKNVKSPYGDGRVSKKIVQILKKTDFSKLTRKRFYDLKVKD